MGCFFSDTMYKLTRETQLLKYTCTLAGCQ